MAKVKVIHQTPRDHEFGRWQLCLQWCEYQYGEDDSQCGYRFIWRQPNGNLQAARGQARIPSLGEANRLIAVAMSEGWGTLDDTHGGVDGRP